MPQKFRGMPEAIVIIPTYNEIENIERLVRNIFSLQRGFEILVVDDNSPDQTAAKVTELITEFPGKLHLEVRQNKQGLGTAYIHGFKWALERKYDYIFEMDADFSHNPEDLIRLYNTCSRGGYDLAIGSRYIHGVNVINWPMGRVLMSYYASAYVRMVTGMPIRDTTAGFKCFRREVLEAIDLDKIRFTGYAFQIEMKFMAWKLGFKVKEISIIFTDRSEGESKMSKGIFKEAVLGVIQLRLKTIFRKPRRKTPAIN